MKKAPLAGPFHGDDASTGLGTALVRRSRKLSIDALPLGDVLSDDEIARLRLVKVDVEGAEWSVLQGLRPVLPGLHRDVEFGVEVDPANAASVFEVLESAGFNACGLPNLYSCECCVMPLPIVRSTRTRFAPTRHCDAIFSRRDLVELWGESRPPGAPELATEAGFARDGRGPGRRGS